MSDAKRIVVFFIPPEKIINGGVLSIFSICKTSREFFDIHGADVYLSVYPGKKSYKKNDLFKNDEVILEFDEIVKKGTPEMLQLHVPEYASHDVLVSLQKYKNYLGRIKDLSVNILNQNILLMQPNNEVAKWFSITNNVTQTTAHSKYATQELSDKYYLPTHHLSTFVDHIQYEYLNFEEKRDLIVFSPDETSLREEIISALKTALPEFEFVTIQDMTYEKYKQTMSLAKFAVTFGEGFDGYYVESFFSGGITFAVYNEDFFPDIDFSTYRNTYKSYEEMLVKLPLDIKKYTDPKLYKEVNSENLKKINSLYSFSAYRTNLRNFYLKKYRYTPKAGAGKDLVSRILKETESLLDAKQQLLEEKEAAIQAQSRMIEEKEAAIQAQSRMIEEKEAAIQALLNSRSWKVTKPLRKISKNLKKH